jgi:hypothetical protein
VAAALEPDVEAGLRLIRARQRRMGHILMGLIPFVLVAAFPRALPGDSEAVFIAAAAAYGALLLFYSLRLAFTECPRCEGYYHWKLWSDPFTKRCLHCGLALEAKDG